MTKNWTFDQPLDNTKPTSSAEERAKIAALFQQKESPLPEEVDYGKAFENEQQIPKKETSLSKNQVKPSAPTKQSSPTITTDYKQHLANLVAQNKEAIAQSQKKIEALHQLIDDKNKQNKKLHAISVAIDEL